MIEQKMLQGITLAEKQMHYFNGANCPYCGNPSEYVSSTKVYREDHGYLYYCEPCAAWVGCHHGLDQSFGSLAKKHLRDLRHQTHLVFDPLWDIKVKFGGMKKKAAQAAARQWLADHLKIDAVECHIGMFDVDYCKETIDLCNKVHEQIRINSEKRAIESQERVGAFLVQCARMKLEPQFFEINSLTQYELPHPGKGQLLKFKPGSGEIQWDNGKWQKVENIETFIAENFKQTEDAK